MKKPRSYLKAVAARQPDDAAFTVIGQPRAKDLPAGAWSSVGTLTAVAHAGHQLDRRPSGRLEAGTRGSAIRQRALPRSVRRTRPDRAAGRGRSASAAPRRRASPSPGTPPATLVSAKSVPDRPLGPVARPAEPCRRPVLLDPAAASRQLGGGRARRRAEAVRPAPIGAERGQRIVERSVEIEQRRRRRRAAAHRLRVAAVQASRQSRRRARSASLATRRQSLAVLPCAADLAPGRERGGAGGAVSSRAPYTRSPASRARSDAHAAVQPPSIDRLAPVIDAASSRHRNSASAATCSGVTNCLGRLRGEQHVVDHLLARQPARLHRVGDLVLDQRRPDIAGRDAVDGDALRAVSSATVLVSPATPCLAVT